MLEERSFILWRRGKGPNTAGPNSWVERQTHIPARDDFVCDRYHEGRTYISYLPAEQYRSPDGAPRACMRDESESTPRRVGEHSVHSRAPGTYSTLLAARTEFRLFSRLSKLNNYRLIVYTNY